MPLSKISLRPGINKEGTTYSNEGGWYDSNLVRFRSGYPEKIGGWVRIGTNTFSGVCRELWNWTTYAYRNLLGVGTNQKYYVEEGGIFHDITPWATGSVAGAIALSASPYTSVSGSKQVTVAHTAHGASVGTFATLTSSATFNNVTISGEYEIVSVPDANTYTISSATTANASGAGGGASTARYKFNAGNNTYLGGTGWGTGAWGSGGWGISAAITLSNQLRIWTSDNFGQNLVVAARLGPIYYWDVTTANLDTTTWAQMVLLSSVADAYVPHTVFEVKTSEIQRFAIAIGANSYSPGSPNTDFNPMLVRWSDQEDITEWKASDTNQAGEQQLSHGSVLVTSITTRQEILIFSDSAIYSMQYLGPPYVWGFTVLLDSISIISPNAAVSAATVVYWMGRDKFYSYSGRVETLPCTLRTYVFDDINQDQAYQVVSGTNEGFSEVWWFYPSADSDVNNRYVVYNYLDRIWYHGNLNRTAWLDSSLRDYPLAAFSLQTAYLSIAITDSDTTIAAVNGVSFPSSGTLIIDSEQITYTGVASGVFTGCTRGANNTTAAAHVAYSPVTYSVSNQIMYHETGNDDYSVDPPVALDAYVQSSDFDIGDGHNFGFVWRMLPDITFSGSDAANPSVTLTLEPRQNSGTNYSVPALPTVTRTATIPVEQYTGEVFTRIRGRQMKMRVESTDTGVAWQLGTPRIDIRQDGRKS
jgi:hypothetical protein